ncbi:uncharacterized protein BP01DRAFT_306902 [Aspergillus saccharolyticus JOP 1030-1]|uniref:Uncharacterized protein n=1 Tax=Aspergillus saccharolyticus JOP 1030-1 TaxID=1450539 RepID=A0A318Z1T0_9EURO|nr:hypothetical protein BP01DRAFT_306902 [Aspergillus saccharolyticus JOP 1030-1]PYH40996.1 hypothetical protein BP01DRAFT_306902 [Aspergillus saccharolyticus JOP 1030-1]
MSRSPPSLYSIREEIGPSDHQVSCFGGTTSNIERLPSRLQQSKSLHRSKDKQIEDLSYEISYLKAELMWNKDSKHALQQFQEQIHHLFYKIEEYLIQVDTHLKESEKNYLSLWGISGDDGDNERVGMI